MGVLKLAVFVSRTEVLVERHTHSFSTNSLSLIEVALMMKVPIAFQLLPNCADGRPLHVPIGIIMM